MIFKEHCRVKVNFYEILEISDRFSLLKLPKEVKLDANIIYTTTSPESCELQILYNPDLHLDSISNYFLEKGLDFLSIINPSNEDESTQLDLSNSTIIKIEDDRGKWENGLRFLLITIDKCIIKFITSGWIIPASAFSLSESGLWLIDDLFEYVFFENEYPNTFNANEKEFNVVDFGDYQLRFNVEFEVFSGENKNEWKFQRWPQVFLHKKYKDVVDDEVDIQNVLYLMLALLSYYQNQAIDFTFGRIKKTEEVLSIVKTTNKLGHAKANPSVIKESGESVYDFLNKCSLGANQIVA